MQSLTWIPLFSYMAEITLRNGNKVKYDHVYMLSHNVAGTMDTVNHHCRDDIKDGWKVVLVRFTNFQFISGHIYTYYVA